MDDIRTRQMLDDLADLFLTTPGSPTPGSSAPGSHTPGSPASGSSASGKSVPGRSTPGSDQAGPAFPCGAVSAGSDSATAASQTSVLPGGISPSSQIKPEVGTTLAPAGMHVGQAMRLEPHLRVPGATVHESAEEFEHERSGGPALVLPVAASRAGSGRARLSQSPPTLRLHQEQEDATRMDHEAFEDEPLIAPHVEAVFLGNLPGFAGPWLMQYAQSLVSQHGPVAVLHVGESQVDVELVGAGIEHEAMVPPASAEEMGAEEETKYPPAEPGAEEKTKYPPAEPGAERGEGSHPGALPGALPGADIAHSTLRAPGTAVWHPNGRSLPGALPGASQMHPPHAAGYIKALPGAGDDAPLADARGSLTRSFAGVLGDLQKLKPRPLGAVILSIDDQDRLALQPLLETMDRWVILCGADDPALVGAYRLLKQLSSWRLTEVGMMVMGSEETEAEAGAARLAAAAQGFLSVPVDYLGFQKRMTPVRMQFLGSFQLGKPMAVELELALTSLGIEQIESTLAEFQPRPAADQATEEVPVAEMATAAAEIQMVDLPAAMEEETQVREQAFAAAVDEPVIATAATTQAKEPVVAASERAATAPPPEAKTPAPEVKPPAPEVRHALPRPEAKTSASEVKASLSDVKAQAAEIRRPIAPEVRAPEVREPEVRLAETRASAEALPRSMGEPLSLAAYLPGSVGLEARCPFNADIQLALDQDGRLHLLYHVTEKVMARLAQNENGLRQAVLELLATGRWVREHAGVLQLTQRQCRIDSAAEPGLHLFTDQPKTAVALSQRLGGQLKVHLLQQVFVGQGSTWTTCELT
ncbi:MAG: hypothetical protein IT443_04090 [Phycisphaeraceae bacterium]|nr:hypothetical protein [Phycisphaeraceae bacterium]